jgi:hypothetical protein
VNAEIAAVGTVKGVNTTEEIQTLVTIVVEAATVIQAYAVNPSATAPTVETYATAGVTGVTAENLTAVNAEVASVGTILGVEGVDTPGEIQALVNEVNLPSKIELSGFTLSDPFVTKDGKVYYEVDFKNPDQNYQTHNFLDDLLNGGLNTVDTQTNGAVAGVDDERTVIVDGYTLVLPSLDEMKAIKSEATDLGIAPEWVNPSLTEAQQAYYIGIPEGWQVMNYATSTEVDASQHYYFYFSDHALNPYLDTSNSAVIFQVLAPAPVVRSAADMTPSLIEDPYTIYEDNGLDTLALIGENISLDLSAIGDDFSQGIEAIDLTGSGDNELVLTIADVLSLSDTTDVLIINGDKGDEVNTSDFSDTGNTQVLNGINYAVYDANNASSAQLWLHPEVELTSVI